MADGVAMKLRAAVDGFGLEGGGESGIGVFEAVDFTVDCMLQAPCSAEVDDLDAAGKSFGDPLAGLLVWGREEEDFDTGVDDTVPAEGMDRVGMNLIGGQGGDADRRGRPVRRSRTHRFDRGRWVRPLQDEDGGGADARVLHRRSR